MPELNYERWHRELIDRLWDNMYELNRLKPPPPITTWYHQGLTPEQAHQKITTTYQPTKRKQGGNGRPSIRLYK